MSRIATPRPRCFTSVVVDVFRGAHVQPPRRLRGDQQHRILVELAAQHHLLLVAPGQVARHRVDRAGPYVELFDQAGRMRQDRARLQDPVARKRRALKPLEDHVLGNGELEDQAHRMAVFGDVAQAGPHAVIRRSARDVDAGKLDAAGNGLDQPGDRQSQFPLAVAIHPSDADDLAARRAGSGCRAACARLRPARSGCG